MKHNMDSNKSPAGNLLNKLYFQQNKERKLIISLATLGILIFLLITSLAPFKDKINSLLYPKPKSYAAGITVSVNPGQTTPVGNIFGTLLREAYFRATDPVRPWAAIRYATQTIDRMLELAPINGQKIPIRGGDADGAYGNDGGHWWRLINPSYPNVFDPGPWATDPDEYMEFVNRVNGQAQWIINFGSDTANQAARLVSYLNGTNTSDPEVQLRIAHGFPQPYNETIFEVGNELYASWETGFSATQPCSYANPARDTTACLGEADPNWYNKPTSNIDNYANRLVEYARAMRAKSPIPITIYAVGGDWALGFPIGIGGETWIKRLVSIAGDDIDGFVLHFYPDNSYFGEDNISLLGRVEANASNRGQEGFAGFIDNARNWAAQQRTADGKPPKDYKIAVTEYNFRASTGGFEAQGYSLVNGLFIADNLRLYANKGIDLANYFAIRMTETSNSAFSFFHNSDVNRPAPMFYALKLFTKHFGTQVVNSSVSGSNIITAPGGNRGSFTYNSLTSTASLSADGKTLYLIVVNKDLTNPQTATLDIQNFSYSSARAWELNGPTPESTNEVADTVKITDLGTVSLTPGYTFPAHSVTAFELTQGPGGPTPTPAPTSSPAPTPTPGAGFNLVADVSSEETALGMVEYGNDLYTAFHTNPKNGGPGTIVRYNDSTGAYGTAYSIPAGQGLGDIRVLNNKIYVNSIDSGGAYGELYTYNGSTWQAITTNPISVTGLFDIEYYNNRFYVTGYAGDGRAMLLSSPDGITNWSLAYSQQYVGSDPNVQYMGRFTQIALFNGKMFFTPQTSNDPTTYSMEGRPTVSMYFDKEIFSYDGTTTFTPIEFTGEVMEVTDMEVFNNALYLSVWGKNTNVTGMWRTTDGVNFSPVSFFAPSATKTHKLSELIVYNNKLYAAEYLPGTPPQVAIYTSSDGTSWTQEFSIPASQSIFSSGSWFNHTALGVYNGKLYAVPPAQGRLYVLGASPISSPTPTPVSSPTPTPIPTPTPSPTPTHSPTPTPSPSPVGDTTPPNTMFTSPVDGSHVSGSVSVTALASDNVSVSRVEFYLDGVLKVTDSTSPYSFTWDSTLASNGTHTWSVRAYDPSSNIGTDTTTVAVLNGDTQAPSAPTNLSASSVKYNSVSLSWTASTDNVGVAGYWIVRNGVTIGSAATSSYTDNGVVPSTTYQYLVIAYDAAGNNSAPSNAINVITPAAPDIQPPTAPSNLIASVISSTQINLSWSASSDNVGVAGYNIYRNNTRIATIQTNSFGDSTLSPATAYSYYVVAFDGAGNVSAASLSVSASTLQPPVANGSIMGIVYSSSGGVVSGAKVSIMTGGAKRTYMTNSSGVYAIFNLPPANYYIAFSAKGYVNQRLTIAVSAGTTTTQNVTLKKR